MFRLEWLTRGARSTPTGWMLVTVQGLLFVGIGFWPSSWGPLAPALPLPGAVLFAVGGAGMIASGLNLGRALTPLPEPNGEGMSSRGLYALVRHPMYASILVVCVGVALARGAWVVWGLAAALYALFEVKTRHEERHLVAAYDGYAEYASATGKFLPLVGRRHPRQ